jgi:hypothetical protein
VYFLAAESLANALTATGAVDRAIDALEAAAVERHRSYDPSNGGSLAGYMWLRTRTLQAELCAKQGWTTEKNRLADEVIKLLTKADSDFPLLQRALRLRTQQQPHT